MVAVLQKLAVLNAEQRQIMRRWRDDRLGDQDRQRQTGEVIRQRVSDIETPHLFVLMAEIFTDPELIAAFRPLASNVRRTVSAPP